jgi:hypothetical protein
MPTTWLRKLVSSARTACRASKGRFRPEVTLLEDRRLLAVSLLNNFAGIARSGDALAQPPDTIAAAGPNAIIEIVNNGFVDAQSESHLDPIIRFSDKLGNTLADQSGLSFFSSVGASPNLFDPVVTYDELAGRFLVAVLDVDEASSRGFIDFAISNDSDPMHGFSEKHRFEVTELSSSNKSLWGDFPRLGWNADAFVFTVNMFSFADGNFDHVQVISIVKSSVLDHNPATLSAFRSDRFTSPAGTHFTMAPAVMHGALPGNPMWFVEETEFPLGPGATLDPNSMRVVRMSGVLTTAPLYSDFAIGVPAYAGVTAPVQPGGDSPVPKAIDTRVLNAALRGTTLVASQNVGTGLHTLARWYQFDIAGLFPTLTQSGDIDRGPGVDTYYPAIDIAANGDLGMSFIESSLSEPMSMYVTGRTPSDPLGVMQTPVLVKTGEAVYKGARAGDFSGISVDPASPATFWAANEYAADPGVVPAPNWGTWIAHFSLNGPDPNSLISRSRAFVAQVYHDLLHRPVDPVGLSAWSAAIDQGMSTVFVVMQIEMSAEYRAVEVQQIYQTILGRPADPLGLINGIAFLVGHTVEQLESSLLASPEFFQRAGGTNAGFLNALYQSVLGRPIDATAAIHFGGMLSLGIARDVVANQVLTSPEAIQRIVEAYYESFLDRAADPDGLAGFTTFLQRGVNARQPVFVGDMSSGVRDEDVIALIIGSPEYFARV